jgi:hypothetical protein
MLLLSCLLLTGCDWIDRNFSPAAECYRREGDFKVHVGWRNCLDFEAPKRMHGVWYNGFEESGFVPNVNTVSLDRDVVKDRHRPEFDTFLDTGDLDIRKFGIPPYRHCTQAIAIDFVGRRSQKRGPYYTGTDNHVVAVDKLLSARLIGEVHDRLPNRPRRCG